MNPIKTKNGSAMVLALIVLSIATIIFSGIIQQIASQLNYSNRFAARERALHMADAGVEYYKWYLSHETDGMQMQEIMDFWNQTSPYPQGVNAPYEDDFEGIGRYKITVTPPESGSTVITMESVGWTYAHPEITRTIRAKLRVGSWSEYVILANSNINIKDGEDVNGKVHSNGGVQFDGVSHNTVSSAMPSYISGGTTRDGVWTSWSGEYNTNMGSNVFLAGKNFPVPEKDFDSIKASLSQIAQVAEEMHLKFGSQSKGKQVVLNGDTMTVYTVMRHDSQRVVFDARNPQVFDIPDVGALYVNKSVWVEGHLGPGKKLVIATEHSGSGHGSIYISNDITYDDYTSGTVLGLVAEDDIELVEGSENDIRIDAALVAETGKVWRGNYSGTKNSITVYGAIATNQGYGFNGYTHKNIIYDSSLILNPPPYFPIEGIYRIDHWEVL